jgi:hypothetical protein
MSSMTLRVMLPMNQIWAKKSTTRSVVKGIPKQSLGTGTTGFGNGNEETLSAKTLDSKKHLKLKLWIPKKHLKLWIPKNT